MYYQLQKSDRFVKKKLEVNEHIISRLPLCSDLMADVFHSTDMPRFLKVMLMGNLRG